MAGICQVRTFILLALIGTMAAALKQEESLAQSLGSHRAKRAILVQYQSAAGPGNRVERDADDDESPGGDDDEDGSPGGDKDNDKSPGDDKDDDKSPSGDKDDDKSPGGDKDDDGSPGGDDDDDGSPGGDDLDTIAAAPAGDQLLGENTGDLVSTTDATLGAA